MRQRLLGSIGALLAGAGLAMAQPMPSGSEAKTAEAAGVEAGATMPAGFGHGRTCDGMVVAPQACGPCGTMACDTCDVVEAKCYHMTNRFWVSAEYLGWWVKEQRVAQPLLTTATGEANLASETIPGTIGAPGTRTLFGENDLGLSMFSGGRLTVGFVIDDHRNHAIEASAFALGERGGDYRAASDPVGNPVLARPIFRPETNSEAVFLISFPDAFAGGIIFDWRTQFWGTEINYLCNVVRSQSFSCDLLVGARYLDLDEDFRATDVSEVLGGGVGFFNGRAVDVGNSLAKRDIFETSNAFYGGQIGGKVEYRDDCWYVLLKLKVALGVSHEDLRIDGSSSVTSGAFINSLPGGLLTASSNIGHYQRDQFAVVPEVGMNVGFTLSNSCRIFAGYSFTYLSNVVRPGEQIDRTVNLSLTPTSPAFGTNNVPAAPRPLFQTTDFWAHGINVGAAFRF